MNKRLTEIFNNLKPCKKFADVGCDHGYIAKAVLDCNKADSVVVSDISAPSLLKAQRLLEPYGKRVKAVVCDGLKKVDADTDQVLIAGMGGEEIISILLSSPFLPKMLVLQPMKNADKVRKSLLSIGYKVERDYTFRDDKFYNLIVAVKGCDEYTEDQLFFGRDNLKDKPQAFMEYCAIEYQKYKQLSEREGLSQNVLDELNKLKNKYREVLDED